MASSTDGVFVWRGLLILLVLSPLPSGSVSPLAQAFLSLGVYTLLTIWAVRSAPIVPRQPRSAKWRLHIILACWVLAVAFSIFQVLPLPQGIIRTLSPSLHDLYGWTLPKYENGTGWRTLSTTPGTTIQSGLLIGACGAAFLLITRLGRTRKRILALALTVVLVGAGEAIYGLAQVGGSLTRPASGTFVNRNHFSGLLAIALCVGAGLLLSRWQGSEKEADAPESSMRLDRWARGSPLIMATLTILAGIIFSFSRMGLSAPFLILGLFGSLWMFGPVSNRVRLITGGIGAIILLLFAGAWPALEVVAERFQVLEESYRIAAWEGTYSLFQSSPIVGIGLGGLVDNLPRFLPDPIQDTFDHSHNEPLEILAEGGVIYAGLFGIGLIVYFDTLIPAWLARRDPLARGLGLGCLAGTGSILLHSLVEFPLRMPANALYLSVLMGLGWVVIQPRTSNNSHGAMEITSRLPMSKRVFIVVVALGGIALSAVAGMADLLDRTGDAFMMRATGTAGEARQVLLAQALTVYTRSSQIEPWQPSHPYKLGRAYEMSASSLPPLSDSIQVAWDFAAESYRQAAYSHPTNARLQVALAWASLQSGDIIAGRRAVRAALQLVPADPEVRYEVSRWYLMQWGTLPVEEQHFAISLIERGARELPGPYVEAVWQLVRDIKAVRSILPNDPKVRRLLLKKLTEHGLFVDRWAEIKDHSYLRGQASPNGFQVLAQGELLGRQRPPQEAVTVDSWTGMVAGWLSGGLTAKVDLDLPPGEIVLYLPRMGQSAGRIWPILAVTLNGHNLPFPAIVGPGWRTAYILLATPGGKLPVQAILTNGAVILENGEFVERRATLGAVRILTPTISLAPLERL